MHLQKLSVSEFYLNPATSSPSTRHCVPHSLTDPFLSTGPKSKLRHGFCGIRKRLSESAVVLRCNRDLVGVKSEGFIENDDAFYMRRCVEIANKAIGCTSPNPLVGCVIVKDGKIVGEGFHPKAGQPHAEVFALRDAGDLAENSTAYVSLEPCNHYGRTPPCTEALIRAKVKRVVVGMVDPNPIVASKGLQRLRDSGIEVKVGVEEDLCRRLNEVFIHHILTRTPFATLRYSVSVNGLISNMLGEGAIESGGYYSQLLQEYDGIILFSASLTGASCLPMSKESQCRQPKHIIVASSSNFPIQLPLIAREASNQAIIFMDKNMKAEQDIALQGIETVVVDELHLGPILDYCGRQGLCSVLLDLQGLSGVSREFLEEGFENGLLQKVVMELLPVWDGSGKCLTPPLMNLKKKVHRLTKLSSRMLKESVLVEGYF